MHRTIRTKAAKMVLATAAAAGILYGAGVTIASTARRKRAVMPGSVLG